MHSVWGYNNTERLLFHVREIHLGALERLQQKHLMHDLIAWHTRRKKRALLLDCRLVTQRGEVTGRMRNSFFLIISYTVCLDRPPYSRWKWLDVCTDLLKNFLKPKSLEKNILSQYWWRANCGAYFKGVLLALMSVEGYKNLQRMLKQIRPWSKDG